MGIVLRSRQRRNNRKEGNEGKKNLEEVQFSVPKIVVLWCESKTVLTSGEQLNNKHSLQPINEIVYICQDVAMFVSRLC